MTIILRSKILMLLLVGDTTLLRLWFALGSLSFGFWVLFDPMYPHFHSLAIDVAVPRVQILLFFIHGFATLYGVLTQRYSTVLLFFEGIVGVFLWIGLGMAEAVQQGSPGPMLVAGGGMSMFLLIRYPTHYKGSR